MRTVVAAFFAVVLAVGSLTVTRASQACEFAVSPTGVELDTAARNGTVSITTQPGCAWTVDSTATWLHMTTSGGTGSGVIAFTTDAVGAFGPVPRQGRLRIRWNTPT